MFVVVLQLSIITSIFTFLWYRLYYTLRNSYKLDGEFTTRIIAALHAVVVVIMSFIALKFGPDPLSTPGEPNTPLQIITMEVSLGYFLYDFVWCIKFQPEIKLILVHHFASILSLAFILVAGVSGGEAVGGLGSMEITNPLLQARWFLRTFNKRQTILYQVTEYTFFAMFLSVRLGYGSYLLYATWTSEKTLMMVKLCTLLMYFVSLALIYTIIDFIIKKVNRRNRSVDEDVKLS